MKRIIIYIVILAAVIAAPVKQQNIGTMKPVRVVSVYKEDDWTIVETDTEDRGIGGTVEQAVQNLKDTANGIIYLDTAEYLLLSKDVLDVVEEIRQELKPSARLCMVTRVGDLSEAAKYLDVHGELPKLKNWKNGQELPLLSTFGDSLIFLKKVENRA